jgi:hypothetical protein
MDQHGLSCADMVPYLGTPSRVNEAPSGKRCLSLTMAPRLRARFSVPADLLPPSPETTKKPRRSGARRGVNARDLREAQNKKVDSRNANTTIDRHCEEPLRRTNP